jgi:outer membrane receptor protein involved in Fe transport
VYLFPRGNDFNNYMANFEVYDPARNLMTQNWPSLTSDIIQNPNWILNRNKSIDTNKSFNSIIALNYKFTNWLSVKARGGYNKLFNQFDKKMYAGTNETLAPASGRYIYSNSENTQLYGDLIATINTKFNDDFSFNANVGTNITKTSLFLDTTIDSGKGGLKYVNWFNLNNFNSASASSQTTGTNREIQSVFASTTFGYKDMVYLDLTGRNDWSSTLANTDKVNSGYFYPSVGVTGILTQMFKMPESISFAKVRASYAQVGNDLTPYLTSPTSTLVNGSVQAPLTGPAPGTSLKPESQNSFEIGTEWRFVNNRFGIDLTYYDNITKDQLITLPAPLANPFGYKNYAYNAGSISNKGIELTLTAKAVKTDNFSWDTSVNFAQNKNEVVSLSPDLKGGVVLTDPGSNNYRYSLIEGRPFGVIEGINIVKKGGVIQLDETGRLQKTDWEEVGNANPDFMLGWSNSFAYKKFSLNFIIDGRFGGEVMSMTQAMLDAYGVSKVTGDARAAGGVAVNAVYAPGTTKAGQVVSKIDTQEYYEQVGDRNGITGEYVYSATNVKLGELSLGYNFELRKDSFLKTASLSLVGRNLFFFYNEAPFDPNVSLSTGEGLQGVDVFGAPSTRSIGMNLNFSF